MFLRMKNFDVILVLNMKYISQWLTQVRQGVSNHVQIDRLPSSFFTSTSKEISKIRITRPMCRNPRVVGEFPSQRASNAESLSHVMLSPWFRSYWPFSKDVHTVAKRHMIQGCNSYYALTHIRASIKMTDAKSGEQTRLVWLHHRRHSLLLTRRHLAVTNCRKVTFKYLSRTNRRYVYCTRPLKRVQYGLNKWPMRIWFFELIWDKSRLSKTRISQ